MFEMGSSALRFTNAPHQLPYSQLQSVTYKLSTPNIPLIIGGPCPYALLVFANLQLFVCFSQMRSRLSIELRANFGHI